MVTPVFDHDDLASLCTSVPSPGRELFHSNHYYGFDVWVKRAAGWPVASPLKVIHPHGISFSPTRVTREEVEAHLPVVAVFPAYRRVAYARATAMETVLGASPFLYAAHHLDAHRPARSGTLFFPMHSTAAIEVVDDDVAHVRDLDALPARLRPVTVCIYWADYQLGRHRTYLDAGYRVVTCGHRNRSDFTDRLWDLLRSHENVACHDLGSQLFYASVAGCRVFWLNPERTAPPDVSSYQSRAMTRPEADRYVEAIPDAVGEEARRWVEEVLRVFAVGEPDPTLVSDQRRVADYFLGARHLRDRGELRELLDWAEQLDRRRAPGRRVPPVVRRNIHRFVRRVRNLPGGVARRLRTGGR